MSPPVASHRVYPWVLPQAALPHAGGVKPRPENARRLLVTPPRLQGAVDGAWDASPGVSACLSWSPPVSASFFPLHTLIVGSGARDGCQTPFVHAAHHVLNRPIHSRGSVVSNTTAF